MNIPPPAVALNGIANARLPAWLLPVNWPVRNGEPVTADLRFQAGKISSLLPADPSQDAVGSLWRSGVAGAG